KESLKETAEHATPSTITPSTPQAQQQFAVNDEPSVDPMKMPEVRYRGKDTKQMLSTTQKRMQDSIDAARLKAMATPKALAAPTDLHLEPLSPGAIFIRWKAVEGALSYIVEWKTENDENFKPVTQISQTGTRITSLESGKTYFVRVIAASGERTGPASDAKSIVVP
ncbi:MAG: fibronectin type III domain-containing protein, partial [Bacteroidota bacterium]|nr:fibronectin type III domain-containing protein [Bacteroidota bacterium]